MLFCKNEVKNQGLIPFLYIGSKCLFSLNSLLMLKAELGRESNV